MTEIDMCFLSVLCLVYQFVNAAYLRKLERSVFSSKLNAFKNHVHFTFFKK